MSVKSSGHTVDSKGQCQTPAPVETVNLPSVETLRLPEGNRILFHDCDKAASASIGPRWSDAQNPGLGALLLATGEAEIMEDSPVDSFRRIGPDGEGRNWAERVLMDVRESMRDEV